MSEEEIQKYVANTAKTTLQKQVTALAFAIIKLKPENISTRNFCETLRQQYENKDFRDQTINNTCSIELRRNVSTSQFLDSNEIFSNTITQEASQILTNFKNSFSYDGSQQIATKVLSDFEVIQAVEYIKKSICAITRINNFDDCDITMNNFESQRYSTQDSGYRSSMDGSDSYLRRNTDMGNLNRSLSTLVTFLNNICTKNLNKDILELASTVFGKALDQLYGQNIYLTFYDTVIDILDDVIKKLQGSNTEEDVDKLILKFSLFNKSYVLLNYSLSQLTDDLEVVIDKILLCKSTDAIEINDPDGIHYLFYIFHLFEILLKRKNSYHSPSTKSTSQNMKDCSMKKDDGLFNNENELNKKYTKLFNKIIFKCSETYPLIAFWATECYNIIINKNLYFETN